ncbi:MAG: glycosyl hydrolase family 18 protein [Micrococcales bacterium]|nr:glycosyl hydrolase family 18 protein [Micrococcales bacterium]
MSRYPAGRGHSSRFAAILSTLALGLTIGALAAPSAGANPPDKPYPGGQNVPPPARYIIGGYFDATPSASSFAGFDWPNIDVAYWAFSTIGLPGSTNDGQCTTANDTQHAFLKDWRATHPNTKIIRSIGGWGGRGFSEAVRTQAGREKLAASCVERYLDKESVDGFDFDWEFPVYGGPGYVVRDPSDLVNHNLMVIEFRKAMNEWAANHGVDPTELWLTAAIPAGRWEGDGSDPNGDGNGAPYEVTESFDLEFLGRTLNIINIMTYEMGTGYVPISMPNQPLYPSPLDTSGMEDNSGVEMIRHFIDAGVEPQKLSYGMGWTGPRGFLVVDTVNQGMWRRWTGTGCGNASLANARQDSRNVLIVWDDYAKNQWYFDVSARRLCSLETAQTIGIRAKWAVDNGLGGFFSWRLNNNNTTQQAEIRATVREFYPSKVSEPLAPTVAGQRVLPVKGVAWTGEVAHISGSSATLAQASAVVNWGDLTRSTATVVEVGPGEFSVRGTHTYAATGAYTMTVAWFDALSINNVWAPAWATVGIKEGIEQDLEVSLTGGDLSMSVPVNQTVSFGSYQLNGGDIIIRGHAMNPAVVIDARGTGEGWTLVAAATDFVGDNTGRRILAGNLGLYPNHRFAPAVDEGLAHDAQNVPMLTSGPPIWPGQYGGLSTPKTVCYAGGGVSTGSFACGAELLLGIPWSTVADHYTSVLTVTLI